MVKFSENILVYLLLFVVIFSSFALLYLGIAYGACLEGDINPLCVSYKEDISPTTYNMAGAILGCFGLVIGFLHIRGE
jgi:hypothetical protein